MVLKYRDVIRMTLFGRHDKLLNDTTSIYQGYDRYQQTATGGGINSASIINSGTVYFTSYPIVYFSNALNFGATSGTTTLSLPSAQMSPIYSVSLTSGGSGFTSAPNVIITGTGTGAVITAAINAGAITSLNIQNAGSGFTAAPTVSFNGGGFVIINAILTGSTLTSFTIVFAGSGFTSAPTIVISGGGVATQTTTCSLFTGAITAIQLPTVTTGFTSAPTISFYGGGGAAATATIGSLINSISLPLTPYGTFTSQPTISFNGGGVITITPQMNGGNTIVTGFNITNGGYVGCFSSAPTIVLSGTGYATCTCTINGNGQINAINLPVVSGTNLFTAAPTVSVYGGGLPTTTAGLLPYTLNYGGYSLYQNIKRLRFDLNQEFQAIRIANGAVIFLEFIRMPALTNLSTCYKNLRVIGAQNITVFDSTQGTTGNPILFTCEGGNNAVNYFLSNTEYSRLPVPPNFLNKGYIEFELDTVLTAANNGTVYTPTQLNDLIIKVVIAEPHLDETQDNNLSPDYTKQDYQIQRVYNKQPLRK